ncbi:MAG: aminotransferase class III-fold pyridoxal phosphate-dependent enzyme, partial [Coriobacteriales bacterium]|nr:aminotransferase class III-fold pyridoxal phosphate-dependent enzyme [Coriobacteriales bacterium]
MDANFENIKKLDSEYILHTYARKNVCFVEGNGMRLKDIEGNEYIDFLSCIGSMSLGYGHPQIIDVLCNQAKKLTNSSNLFFDKNKSLLAQNIVQKLGGGFKLFFTNSGAESNEGAIKLARLYGRKNLDGAYGIITAKKSFHGRTVATLSATGQDSKQDPFRPLLNGFTHVEINNKDELKQAVEQGFDETCACAIMLEPVLGEGGVWPLDLDYLQYARQLCNEHNLVLILDEVQTGLGRCGKFFAFEHYDIKPDIITLAKGMGAGMSIGAFAANDKLA